MRDEKQRGIIRGMAVAQIQQLGLLVEAIDTADAYQRDLASATEMIATYAEENMHMRNRIKEDEATIQFKDGQLRNAEIKVKKLKEENEANKEKLAILTSPCEDKSEPETKEKDSLPEPAGFPTKDDKDDTNKSVPVA